MTDEDDRLKNAKELAERVAKELEEREAKNKQLAEEAAKLKKKD